MRIGLPQRARQRLATLAAVLAALLQALMPGALAHAEARGLDVSAFLCGPSAAASDPALLEAAAELAALAGLDLPPGQSDRDPSDAAPHCPACAFAHGAPLPEPVLLRQPLAAAAGSARAAYDPGFVRGPQGPPLGSRGPPHSL